MTYPTTSPLDVEMGENDAGAKTVRDYLIALLRTLLDEEEGFSGKRPFGNSGWMGDLQLAFVKSGHVKGKLDEYGYLDDFDGEQFNKVISQCLTELRSAR